MNSEFPKRKSNRLKEYDYSENGCYFVTVCTKDKKHLLSHYRGTNSVGAGFRARPRELIIKTPLGYDVERTILHIAKTKNITVDNYIIMPNHIHLLITLDNNGYPNTGGCENPQDKENLYAGGRGNPPLQDIIGQLKSYTTKLYRERMNDKAVILWQRGFYDHIIRNEDDFLKTWEYIEYNALKEYPEKI